MRVEPIADEAVNVVAIVALVAVALEGGADPTTVTGAIAGLGGYRMRRRSQRPTNSQSELPPKGE